MGPYIYKKHIQFYAQVQQQLVILKLRGNSMEPLSKEHQSINNLMTPHIYTLICSWILLRSSIRTDGKTVLLHFHFFPLLLRVFGWPFFRTTG